MAGAGTGQAVDPVHQQIQAAVLPGTNSVGAEMGASDIQTQAAANMVQHQALVMQMATLTGSQSAPMAAAANLMPNAIGISGQDPMYHHNIALSQQQQQTLPH